MAVRRSMNGAGLTSACKGQVGRAAAGKARRITPDIAFGETDR